ncbi:Kinesin-like protein like protein [Aduncisulcus paluster]|uniref:Kinesin-like protein like protein n=1 Tax=Aduncisulcus paluster TaxID=2918883 RepID=A0ABQ5K6X4_9EUKA|nr:Kinesin-like protein like protein [Aduncisulcus paluster]
MAKKRGGKGKKGKGQKNSQQKKTQSKPPSQDTKSIPKEGEEAPPVIKPTRFAVGTMRDLTLKRDKFNSDQTSRALAILSRWTERVLGLDANYLGTWDSEYAKSGIVLIKLMSYVSPSILEKGHDNLGQIAKMPMLGRENVSLFLDECRNLGFSPAITFDVDMYLSDKQHARQTVCACLYFLSGVLGVLKKGEFMPKSEEIEEMKSMGVGGLIDGGMDGLHGSVMEFVSILKEKRDKEAKGEELSEDLTSSTSSREEEEEDEEEEQDDEEKEKEEGEKKEEEEDRLKKEEEERKRKEEEEERLKKEEEERLKKEEEERKRKEEEERKRKEEEEERLKKEEEERLKKEEEEERLKKEEEERLKKEEEERKRKEEEERKRKEEEEERLKKEEEERLKKEEEERKRKEEEERKRKEEEEERLKKEEEERLKKEEEEERLKKEEEERLKKEEEERKRKEEEERKRKEEEEERLKKEEEERLKKEEEERKRKEEEEEERLKKEEEERKRKEEEEEKRLSIIRKREEEEDQERKLAEVLDTVRKVSTIPLSPVSTHPLAHSQRTPDIVPSSEDTTALTNPIPSTFVPAETHLDPRFDGEDVRKTFGTFLTVAISSLSDLPEHIDSGINVPRRDAQGRPVIVIDANCVKDKKDAIMFGHKYISVLNELSRTHFATKRGEQFLYHVIIVNSGRVVPQFSWLTRMRKNMPRTYRKGIQTLVIVYKNPFTRGLAWVMSVFGASPKFAKKITFVKVKTNDFETSFQCGIEMIPGCIPNPIAVKHSAIAETSTLLLSSSSTTEIDEEKV